ncbi:MscS Mechanosensitive ion channel [Thiomonas sp. CB2]|nr:MscS Mechanosensitive ion channel [Thiomonas sp. CB2]CQR42026.1 MscS Mechanosensitive ion channel [Thiomonas sp. CB3]
MPACSFGPFGLLRMLIESPLIAAFTHQSPEQLRLQIGILLGVVALGVLLGTALEKQVRKLPNWKTAFRATWRYGLGFPAVALLALVLVRHGSHLLLKLPLLKLALPVLVVLLLVRLAGSVARQRFSKDGGVHYLVRVVSIGLWVTLALHLAGVLPEIHEALDALSISLGSQRLSGWTLLKGAASIAVTLLLALWVSSLLEARLMRSPLDASLRLVFTRLLRSVVLLVAILTALQMVGIDLTVLSVFGGALGVGLGLGLQKIAANYVSGFVILLERSLRVGDNVRVETFQGQIIDIKTRYTLVRSAGGTDSIVPNEMLIANRIENLSYNDPNVWLSTTVGVSYDTDVEKALVLIKEAAQSVPRVLQSPGPSAVLDAFGESAINITVGYWIADPEHGTLGVRGQVNLAIWHALKQNGIEIPFPQRVLQWAPGKEPAAQAAERQ